jgi:acetyl esterase/lipase
MQNRRDMILQRREFLGAVAGVALTAPLPPTSLADTAGPTGPTTVIYKTVGSCQIKADIHGATSGTRKPAVMWLHGGALITGNRQGVDRRFAAELLERGFVIVSVDYRLAPETKLPGIIEDIQDAWKWVRTEGSKQFGIDPDRIATAGGSAGGYLTLMTGFCLDPRPRALVSYYGYGELTAPWYAEPSEFYRKKPLVTKEEAMAVLSDHEVSEPPPGKNRGRFYLYCRQNGIWPKEVGGHDPKTENKWFDPYCPARNVTAKYPRTRLIHGTADTDVPYEESKNMSEKLTQAGVEHDFITLKDVGHGLAKATPEQLAEVATKSADFVQALTK